MKQHIGYVALVVRDYDEAIRWYCDALGFLLVEDTPLDQGPDQNDKPGAGKRWVLIKPPGAAETCILLARAAAEKQTTRVGDQTGGRVFLFLHTDDFWRDFRAFKSKGVVFRREPRQESYGTVAVFEDLYGNLWDLLQLK